MVSKSLPIVAYPALQLLLLSYLKQVIYLQSDVSLSFVSSLASKTVFPPSDRGDGLFDNPLHRVRGITKIAYRSAIAHKLAKISERSAMSWAAEIVNQQKHQSVEDLCSFNFSVDITPNSREFIVKVLPPAEIYFEITNFGLASWLQFLLHTLLEDDFRLIAPLKGDFVTDITSVEFLSQQGSELQNVFVPQYAYARCCSLLHLAETQHLLAWQSRRDVKNTGSAAIAAAQIPWLTPEGNWQLTHPAEQALIAELATTLDTLANWAMSETAIGEPKVVLELVTRLSEAFLAFHSACRFWGEPQKTAADLVQARLGLVEVTRSLLGILLREGLRVIAPTEL